MSEMGDLLAIDAGNTRVKWARFVDAAMTDNGAVSGEEIARIFAAEVPPRVVASNVAGPHMAALLHEQCAVAGAALLIIESEASRCGVTNAYRSATQLGSDRWAALIAARHLGPGAKLVVMAGTATTIDALTGEGVFLGGVIVPGVSLMQSALHANTAQLGDAVGSYADFPQSTADAIMSGAIQASAGAIERLYEIFSERLQAAPEVVLSGGAAGMLAPYLPFPAVFREHLVLEGLAQIAAEKLSNNPH